MLTFATGPNKKNLGIRYKNWMIANEGIQPDLFSGKKGNGDYSVVSL